MSNRSSTFINTAETGLVVQIQHNLCGMVYPSFYTTNSSGHKIFKSLYAAPILEAKTLDKDTFQVTFSGAFEGFVDLLYWDFKTPTYNKRLTDVEQDVVEIRDVLKQYTNLLQWKQMNAYLEKRIMNLEKENAELRTLYNDLEQEVSEL